MVRPSLVVLLCTAAMPALALEEPQPGKLDPHVRTAIYSPADRTMIVASTGRVTNITFSPQERIKRVVMGKDDGPIAPPDPKSLGQDGLVNNLPLRAVAPGMSDLLVITLMPDASERTYQFLVRVKAATKDGDDDPDATYALAFTYPHEEHAAAVQQAAMTWKEKKAAKEREAAEARMATDVFYGPRNWKYLATGDTSIAPYEASDNGYLSAFRYPGNTTVPSIFLVDSPAWCDLHRPPPAEYLKAPERTARVTNTADLTVVQQTAEHYRMRLGQKVVDVFNCGYDPVGHNPGTGTTTPDVVRQVVTQR